MKIYKITQNNMPFPIWLAEQISNTQIFVDSTSLKLLQKWNNEIKPNLNEYNVQQAYMEAEEYYMKKNIPSFNLTPSSITQENKEDMINILEQRYYFKPNFNITAKDLKIESIKDYNDPIHKCKNCKLITTYSKINKNSIHAQLIYAQFITKDGQFFILLDTQRQQI